MSYFPEVVDNTMRSAYIKCARYAKHQFIDGLNTIDIQWDLHAGIAFAAGTEAARKAFFIEKLSYNQAIEVGKAAVAQAWGNYVPPKSLFKFKTKDRMIGAIPYYFDIWPFVDDGYLPFVLNGTEKLIEKQFEFEMRVAHPITFKPLRYSIRPDMVGSETSTGRVVVLDEKTTGKISDDLAAKYDLDAQLMGYMWGVEKATLMHDISGEIRITGILKNEYGNCTVPLQKPHWLLDAWWNQVNYDFQQMVNDYCASRFPQAFDDACNPYGRSCEYKQLCLATNPERLIDGNYKILHWNPTTRERK